MKLKAFVKGNILILEKSIKVTQAEIEVDIPDSIVQIEQKGKTFSEAIWETIGKFPEAHVNWKKEWHKHLEEKYNG